jgi:hypothetical protein
MMTDGRAEWHLFNFFFIQDYVDCFAKFLKKINDEGLNPHLFLLKFDKKVYFVKLIAVPMMLPVGMNTIDTEYVPLPAVSPVRVR